MTPANEQDPGQVAPRTAALDLLGLPHHASAAQILAAYRRLARATHPDATGRTDPAAGQRFAELHDAFELLTVAQHDESHAQPVGHSAEPAEPAEPASHAPARPARPRPGPARHWRVRTIRPIVAGPVIVTNPTGVPRSQRAHGVGDDH